MRKVYARKYVAKDYGSITIIIDVITLQDCVFTIAYEKNMVFIMK